MKRRVLLIGWDAADWRIINPLLDSGRMPNLARLVGRGVVGDIATLRPPYSPILWTSIATGKRPAKHGITGFIEPTGDGRAVRPVSSLSRKVKALWNILGQKGFRSVVVGWYPSHPAEPLNGVMATDMFVKAGDGPAPNRLPPGSVHPPDWLDRMQELRISAGEIPAAVIREFVPRAAEVDQAEDRRLHSVAHIVAENMTAHSAATEAIEHADWDLACLFYDGIDHFSHGFMRYHPPRLDWVSQEDFDRYSGVVTACYRWHDAMLGRLLQLAGPDVTTIIVSDHGFESGRDRLPDTPAELTGPTQDHRHFGVLVMAGPGIKTDARIHTASLLDITPTILHLFDLPVGRDMDGKVLLSALEQPEPVQRIDSWEQVEGDAGRHPTDRIQEPLAAVEAMKQLEDLGYIAPQAGDAAEAVSEAVLEQHYTLAQSHEDAGRPDLADAEYVKMLELRPNDHRALAGRVSMLLAVQEVTAAQGVLDAFDASATVTAEHAAAELARREAETPATELRKALHAPETRREVHERRKLFQALGGRQVQRMALRANVLLASGDIEAAVAAMDAARVVAAQKGGAFSAAALADFYGRAGRRDLALEHCTAGLAADPTDWHLLGLRARMHLGSGDFEEAVADAAASLGLVYFQPSQHLVLGLARARLGEHAAAEQALLVALAQAPGLLPAHEALAELYLRMLDRPDRAAWHRAQVSRLREFRTVENIDPETSPILLPDKRPAFPTRPGVAHPEGHAPVVVVAGLPRSGTSMLMQALQAGGMPVLSDGLRTADDDNPRGYLEYEPATRLAEDSAWMASARGKAVKIVLPLLPQLPRGEVYRVLLIQRDMREVLASQAAMLRRLGKRPSSLRPRALAAQYISQETMVLRLLETRRGMGVLPLDYRAALHDPHGTAERIAAFLGGEFDAAACAAAIEPALRRQRA